MNKDEKYMIEALKEAKKAYKKKEVPIGAIIVRNDKIIARAYNRKEKTQVAIQHAEILAIIKACKKMKNWRLLDCTLYVTVEPCMMCCGAVIQSRIKKIVYGTKNDNFGSVESVDSLLNKYNIEIKNGILEEKCKKIITEFFNKKRKENF